MKHLKTMRRFAVLFLLPVAACTTEPGAREPGAGDPKNAITCEGAYGGHLQGVATDGSSLYWSFTVRLVKTDLSGRVLASRPVPNHHGDLCVRDGVVYVAVNLGTFNHEDLGVSEVWAYAAKDLEKVGCRPLPACVHGAGGMTCADDRFFVVGGLPATHECNYVYEFDRAFSFVKRHELKTGFTLMGIQTAAYEDGRFIFGIYGCPGDPAGSLECPRDLSSFVRRHGPGDVGIVKLAGEYWTGRTVRLADGKNGGRLVRSPGYPASEKVYAPKNLGKGMLLVVEDDGSLKWTDSGYRLQKNGYRPLCHAEPSLGVFFSPERLKDPSFVVPVVEIGGGRAFSAPDLVRAVRRVAETDEVFALHPVRTPSAGAADRRVLDAALEAARAEAKRLGVKVK